MRLHRILIIGAALLALASTSCKKDDGDDTLPYLTGYPEFDLPPYGQPGETFTFTGKGVRDDDGKDPDGYYWYIDPLETGRDTANTFSFYIPDTLCTITVTCGAFKEGYYSSSISKDLVIIRDSRVNGSLKGNRFDATTDFTFTDSRDGHEYWCTTIGGTDWFKDNLAFDGAGFPLENCPATVGLFGKFYTWEDAMVSCPEGWRLSSLKDWADAAKVLTGSDFDTHKTMASVAVDFMGDIYFNENKMWEYWPEVKITNKSGLSLMPTGYAIASGGNKARFDSMNGYSVFWTSDTDEDGQAYYRYIYEEQPDIMLGTAGKDSFAATARCVRDHE
ncbi:MAG: FISUMP domain-containing protein [Bacteroidia bacterium]|nr:FISUMP domain-containing protein [Bacteroidia bacterium]